ncbi:MAG: tRNA dihydrouridine synthase DusB [Oscillospiraceae bacterium]|nr:tRNA dihydrouridine synthase DusB [Oscillospiraceae bacterium]
MRSVFIGNVEIKAAAALAPMAGVADRAFREICKEFGAAYLIGEMASSKGLTMGSKKTGELLSVTDGERPMAIQLFGSDPETMAKAAYSSLEYKPDILDINMGCPAPKVAGNGGGSSLMLSPELAGEIVKAVCAVVDIPVTVKMRTGWDDEHINAVELAKICEQNGAAAITVHGRTRAQMYSPPVDRNIIADVKRAVSVPVIANGDIISPETALSMFSDTGCDLIMVGRGALGRPWLFSQINAAIDSLPVPADPPLDKRMAIMHRHIVLLCQYKGDHIGMLEARKHVAWYLKGMPGAAKLRGLAGTLSCMDDLDRLIDTVLSSR